MSNTKDRVTVHFYLPTDGETAAPRFSYLLTEDTPRQKGRITINVVNTRNEGPQKPFLEPTCRLADEDVALAYAYALRRLKDHHTAYRVDHSEFPAN